MSLPVLLALTVAGLGGVLAFRAGAAWLRRGVRETAWLPLPLWAAAPLAAGSAFLGGLAGYLVILLFDWATL